MAFNDYRSLLVSGTEGWHDGSGTITYSFLGTDLPNYYREVDTDGDGTNDAWNAGSANIPFGNDFSMTVEQRAMTSQAIEAWNEVANVNLQPGTIARGGTDGGTGDPVTGNGTLVEAGGTALPVNDDGYSLVDMSAVFEEGLNFFGAEYDASQIFVNTNGNITFGSGLSQYTPSGISAGTTPLIAAFWADVDTRAGEPIYVDVDADADVVTITWENVGFYSHHAEPSNSFQMQLFDRGGGDFDIVFRYEDINWSNGDASNSGDTLDGTGLGGVPARAGFSAGNGADFFELPQSGIESEITNLENITGNTGVEGLWVFEVREGAVVGDIAFGSTEFESDSLYGFVSNFPNPNHLGDRPSRAGDMWINRSNDSQFVPGVGDNGGPIFGHTSWNTYLHEMGHALGLRHPNESPGDPDTNSQYTVMSYVPHPAEDGEALIDQAFSLTPMLWDIQALQELYGANTTTRATDTVYFGDGNPAPDAVDGPELEYQYATNEANDLGMQVLGEDGVYRDVILTIWDAGGHDLIDASDLSTGSRIDLRNGNFSSIGEIDNNIAIAATVRDESGQVINYVEDAWGGSGRDRLIGNNGANLLDGNGGRDRLYGNGGRDRLEGDGGNDRLFGGNGNDRLLGGTHHDRLNGGNGNDRLFGNNGRDQLNGGNGNDRLYGGRGDDTFVFSRGNDRAFGFGEGDLLDLRSASGITDFADLVANHASLGSRGLVITDDAGNSMRLTDLTIDDIAADDFLF
ncbi:MAG: nidogen-like domain-containing protein [Pseudophaeobacter sp.]|jgi:Ca2+-binding RTX toxin-like protein|uniref:nidogen-like domain-containing protein n=1 Tax=Pseudophaeobacter sp. TaxID=1971739 RepID=UPI0032D9A422